MKKKIAWQCPVCKNVNIDMADYTTNNHVLCHNNECQCDIVLNKKNTKVVH